MADLKEALVNQYLFDELLDCKDCRFQTNVASCCKFKAFPELDLLHEFKPNSSLLYESCADCRSDEGRCGKLGRWWEPKPD